MTITLYQTSMLKQLYLMTFEMGLVAFAGAPSHFGIILYPVLGRQTLLSINVASFLLTPIGDLNRQRSSFNLHSFCIRIASSSSSKKETFHCKKWLVLLLLQALTPQRMTPLPPSMNLPTPIMHLHLALEWFLSLLPFLSQSFPSPLKSSFLTKFKCGREVRKMQWRILSFD